MTIRLDPYHNYNKLTTHLDEHSNSSRNGGERCGYRRTGDCNSTGVPCERLSRPLRLDTAEPLQLVGFHRHTTAKSNFTHGAPEEGGTIGVERFVDRGDAGRGTLQGWTLRGNLPKPSVAQMSDDGGFHGKLDPVEGDKPNDILDHCQPRIGMWEERETISVPRPRRCQSNLQRSEQSE